VIDNIVWTDSWPSIAGAGCGLICIATGEEQAQGQYRWAFRCEKTSRLGSRDLVADGIKCGPHGGKKCKTKLCTITWLSIKAKIELG
jgi:hypothetical protein